MIAAGDWTLRRTIGSGATATVSLASTSSSGQLFAVKTSPVARSSLLRHEQTILSSLSSPHIISCLGSEHSTESYHLFLELAPGGDLSALAGKLDERRIRSFARQILLALAHLHSHGVSHCDVKSRNVLLVADGVIKLGDFGCARRDGDGDGDVVKGTPAFMSPEAARGEEQGAAGDVWGLGCTVVEMAGGWSNWPEFDNTFSAIYRIGFGSDVPAVPGWVSEEGKDFVSKCFVRDPRERWTAEMLLGHPFVAVEEEEGLAAGGVGKVERWVSPKSTLDFGLWDLEEVEEDDEVDENEFSERIRRLASPEMAAWRWSEGWINCR